MNSFAREHVEDLMRSDELLYGRACAIVAHACAAWRCSLDNLLSYERSPEMDQVRSALTLVAREQTNLSLADLSLVLARNDHASIWSRIKTANAAMMRRLDPIYSAYWSLVGHLRRAGFSLQGRPGIAEHPEECRTLDLRPYLTRPAGIITAELIMRTVCSALKLDESTYLSGKRYKEYADGRTFSYVLMRGELDFSFPQIARAMNMNGHSTMVTACQRFIRIYPQQTLHAAYRDRFARVCDALGIDPSSYPAKLLDRSFPRSAPDTPTRTAGSPGRAPEADASASGICSEGESSVARNPNAGSHTEILKESPTRSPGGKRRPVSLQKGRAR